MKVDHPQNDGDLNQGVLHLWSKFGDPSLKGSWVIPRMSSWLTQRRTHRGSHWQYWLPVKMTAVKPSSNIYTYGRVKSSVGEVRNEKLNVFSPIILAFNDSITLLWNQRYHPRWLMKYHKNTLCINETAVISITMGPPPEVKRGHQQRQSPSFVLIYCRPIL